MEANSTASIISAFNQYRSSGTQADFFKLQSLIARSDNTKLELVHKQKQTEKVENLTPASISYTSLYWEELDAIRSDATYEGTTSQVQYLNELIKCQELDLINRIS